MKTAATKRLIVPFILCLAGFSVPAQFNVANLELGADLTNFIYQGDLTPSKLGSFKTMTFGLGVYGSYKLNRKFALRTSLLFGKLKGDESRYAKPAYRRQRNFAFKTPVTEVSESVVWNIVPTSADGGPAFTPYLSTGIGYTFLHIRRDYSNYNLAYFGEVSPITTGLIADTAHSLPRGLLVLPVSAGLRYALNTKLSLNMETTYRINSSDYLDGFSQSANPKRKDHFFTNSVGIIYSFGKSTLIRCPKMKY